MAQTPDLLDRARDAAARRAWPDAFELLQRADRREVLPPGELPALAQAAFLAGRPTESREVWERIHAEADRQGQEEAAAGAALRVAFAHVDAGLTAPARAWLTRAERLLEGHADSPVWAAAAMIRSYLELYSGEVERALASGREAAEMASRHGDEQTLVFARLAEARASIYLGKVEQGVAVIDDALVSATGGALDPFTAAVSLCIAVCTWQGVADYERAAEWTLTMRDWCDRHDVASAHGACRVHRAQVLRQRGQCLAAEEEARRGVEEMRPFAKHRLGWPLHEIGQIRLRLGDLAGAEQAFLEAHEMGWDAQPGLALLRLAQGDVASAAASIREALEESADAGSVMDTELPPGTDLRRAPRLAAAVEIELAAGELERARGAAGELSRIAETYRTTAHRASAAMATASVRLAEGDAAAARAGFQEALRLWRSVEAPYEVAAARVGIARAHRAAGNEDGARLELASARKAFAKLGAKGDERRVAKLLGGREAAAARRERRVFVFTDIVGSTDLAEAMGDESWSHLVRWHHETLARLVADHGGEVVRTMGDGVFVTFEEPAAALACAVAIQRALEEQRRDHGFSPHVRIGVHVAEATPEDDDWSGVGVHAAARIGAAAGGGEILASAATVDGVGVPASAPRAMHLRGISEPIEVVAVEWR